MANPIHTHLVYFRRPGHWFVVISVKVLRTVVQSCKSTKNGPYWRSPYETLAVAVSWLYKSCVSRPGPVHTPLLEGQMYLAHTCTIPKIHQLGSNCFHWHCFLHGQQHTFLERWLNPNPTCTRLKPCRSKNLPALPVHPTAMVYPIRVGCSGKTGYPQPTHLETHGFERLILWADRCEPGNLQLFKVYNFNP